MLGPRHILLLRHGETDSSRAGIFVGTADPALNSAGQEAAHAWRPTFTGAPVVGWHSPLARAADTARLAGLDSTVSADLREWDLGHLEGQSAEAFRTANPGWNLFEHGPPSGGESLLDVTARAAQVVERIRTLRGDAEGLVLVGHGQFSRVLVAEILGLGVLRGSRLAWGPARAAVLTWRSSLRDYALTGWNRTPDDWVRLTTGNT